MVRDIGKKVESSEGSKMTIFGRFSANISAHEYKFENRYGSTGVSSRGVASYFGPSSSYNKGPSVLVYNIVLLNVN